MDDWLDRARPDSGGLLIPGAPEGRAAALLLAPDSAQITWDEHSVALPWEQHFKLSSGIQNSPDRPGGWLVTGHKREVRSATEKGTAVAVDGELRLHCSVIVDAMAKAHPLASLGVRVLRDRRDFDLVPLNVPKWNDERDRASRVSVCVLVAVLADRPQLRPRLGDQRLIARLAADLAEHAMDLPRLSTPYGVRRQTAEIGTAMRMLGLEHPFDRPLPGDQLPSLDDAVSRVMAFIASNPHAEGVKIDQQRVAQLIRRRYLQIQPWPFQSLTN